MIDERTIGRSQRPYPGWLNVWAPIIVAFTLGCCVSGLIVVWVVTR